MLQAAREQLQRLADRPQAPVNYVVEYTDFWTRQIPKSPQRDPEMNQADWDKVLAEWKQVQGVLVEGGKQRIVVVQNLAEDVLSKLAERAKPDRGSAEGVKSQRDLFNEAILLVGSLARLQVATGDVEGAARGVDEFVKQMQSFIEPEPGKAQAYLAIGNLYSGLGRHADAEAWYRRLREIVPESYALLVRELAAQNRINDAVDICLEATPADQTSPEVAAMLAQLVSLSPQDQEIERRVTPVLSAALKSHGDNVELLQAMAVLKVTRNEDDAAIKDFQRVVELAPKNALALNNLATLLAERPNQRSVALEMVNRALEVSGREPALLDTLGTIQLRSGEYGQAVASLEEAVAGGGGDARYYFHLAAAYRHVNRLDKAQHSLERAQDLGLSKSILTSGDQQLLQELEKTLEAASGPPEHDSRTTRRKSMPVSAVVPTIRARVA